MIYTCTLNPAIDYKLNLDNLELGTLNRFKNASFKAGGKGINVSFVLKNYGIKSKCIGFIGGFTGSFISASIKKTKMIENRFIIINENSRMNVKIMQNNIETELNHEGPSVTNDEVASLLNIINEFNENDILICGGSAPKNQVNIYKQIAEICETKNIKLIMDTPGEYYNDFISYKPFLVKPNIHELSQIFKTTINNTTDVIKYGRELINLGAQNVLISLGSKGSIFLSKECAYAAKPIKGKIESTVGAGDSMVAGFISNYLKTNDLKMSYQMAVVSATLTVFSKDIKDKKIINQYLNEIKITELK